MEGVRVQPPPHLVLSRHTPARLRRFMSSASPGRCISAAVRRVSRSIRRSGSVPSGRGWSRCARTAGASSARISARPPSGRWPGRWERSAGSSSVRERALPARWRATRPKRASVAVTSTAEEVAQRLHKPGAAPLRRKRAPGRLGLSAPEELGTQLLGGIGLGGAGRGRWRGAPGGFGVHGGCSRGSGSWTGTQPGHASR